MFNNKMAKLLVLITLLLVLFFSGCQGKIDQASDETVFYSADLVYDTSVYKNDKDNSVKYLYVTVLGGGEYTLADVKSDRHGSDDFEAVVDVVFQEGNSEGPVAGYFGFGMKDSNATMEIRGATSRFAGQKSFKVRLNRKMSPWKEIYTVNLNKQPYDLIRVRNKLSFDYLEIIQNITSIRTQFVNLFVKDLSENNQETTFIDYGLFTLVEQPNRMFLRTRGLDIHGHMYKAEFFEFHRYEDSLRVQDDPEYNEYTFEEILSIRGEEDHYKLISMLDDVNNYEIPINLVIDKHFNRNNYLTWLAVNILFENIDTNSQNFFLYSPSNNNTWYFVPWDYDGTWGFYNQIGTTREERRPPWKIGVSNYWGVVLHRRFLQEPGNVQALQDKMQLLLDTIITEERTITFLKSYYPIVSKFVNQLPDSEHMKEEYFETEFWRITNEPQNNFDKFIKAKENPMPIFLGIPYSRDDKLVFRWSESFDLQGDVILYDFQVSDSPDFMNIVVEQIGLDITEISIEPLEADKYYWRVTVRDDQENTQTAFDIYRDEEGLRFFGVRTFTVN